MMVVDRGDGSSTGSREGMMMRTLGMVPMLGLAAADRRQERQRGAAGGIVSAERWAVLAAVICEDSRLVAAGGGIVHYQACSAPTPTASPLANMAVRLRWYRLVLHCGKACNWYRLGVLCIGCDVVLCPSIRYDDNQSSSEAYSCPS